jgi:hypothetical protein
MMLQSILLLSFCVVLHAYIHQPTLSNSYRHLKSSFLPNLVEASNSNQYRSNLGQIPWKSAARRYVRPLDDDIDPLKEFDNTNNPKWYPLAALENASVEEKAIAETLNGRIEKLFTFLGSSKSKGMLSMKITKELFIDWESEVRSIASDIRLVTSSKQVALSAYKQLLAVSAPITLDPLHLATFDLIARAVIDNIVKFQKSAPVTEIVDDLTDIHLDYIEPFRSVIDDGGSDG